MELTSEEKEMLDRIEKNQYTGGAYRRATWIEKVCRNKKEKVILDSLCEKALAEKGLGGTVAGDTYRACWLTHKGKELLDTIQNNRKVNKGKERGTPDMT